MAQRARVPGVRCTSPARPIDDGPTFRCERCGQVLKVPDSVAAVGASSRAAPSTAAPSRERRRRADRPPPRRRGATDRADGPHRQRERGHPRRNRAPQPATRRTPAATPRAESEADGRHRARAFAWYWRILAWVVAVPLGFVITAWPAFEFGLIKKDDVLDVFVGSGIGRYVRLLIGAARLGARDRAARAAVRGGRPSVMARRREQRSAVPETPRTRRPVADST